MASPVISATTVIYDIFDEAQGASSSQYRTCIRKLKDLLQKTTSSSSREELFTAILRGCIDKTLVVAKKEPAVEHVIKFFCEFISTTSTTSSTASTNDDLFNATIEHLLRRSLATDKTVRFRSCQIIAGIITRLQTDAEVSDETWSSMIKFLTPRLRDKAPNVRFWAVQAVSRLQNPQDDNDTIITEVLRLMSSDTSKDVRAAAVEAICICKRTLPALIDRIKDIKSEVRMATLKHLAKDIDIRHLTVSMRASIIRFGLNDRDAKVIGATKDLILQWLDRSALDNKVPKLLQLINLHQNEEEAELVTKSIMEEFGSKDESSVSKISSSLKNAIKQQAPNWQGGFSAITASEVFWALIRCEYANAHFAPAIASDMKDILIPDTVKLCEILSNANSPTLVTNTQQQLTVRYLLRMSSFLDSSDISGSAELVKVCKAMIFDIRLPENLVEPVLSAWWRGSGLSLEECIQEVIKMSQEVISSNLASNEGAEGESETEGVLASIRALLMIEWSLQRRIGGNKKSADVSDFKRKEFSSITSFIIDSLQQPYVELRGLAVRCLGLLTLTSESFCDDYYDIILQVAKTDLEDDLVRSQAIQALADMATIYERFKDDAALTNLLLRVQECGGPLLLRVAAESASKLLFTTRLSEPRLFSNMLKFFFLPELANAQSNNDEDEEENSSNDTFLGSSARLSQILSVFFQTFFLTNNSNREVVALDATQELIADISMLIRDNTVDSSAMMKVVGQLLIICDEIKIVDEQENLEAEDGEKNVANTSIQNKFCMRLAAAISREILKLGRSKFDKAAAKELVKALGILSPEEWINPTIAPMIANIMSTITSHASLDKTTQKVIDKYISVCDDSSKSLEQDVDEAIASVAGHSFVSFAPGLGDLVELMGKSSSDIANDGCKDIRNSVAAKVAKKSVTNKSKSITSSKKSSKSKQVESDDEDENTDDDDEDANEDDVEEDVGEEENVPVVVNARPGRSSKIAASLKISSQATEEISKKSGTSKGGKSKSSSSKNNENVPVNALKA